MGRPPRKVEGRYGEMKRAERDGGSILLSKATMRYIAESAADGQFAFVQDVLRQECALRHASRIARLKRAADFPSQEGFDGFEWGGVSFPSGFARQGMLLLAFIERGEGLVLFGGSGNGKTHTAIALGILACDQNKRVLFFSTASLVNELRSATRGGTIQEVPAKIGRADLIIPDEWGHLPTDPDGARPHFRVVSTCHERTSVILTTNIGFSRWGEALNDDDMAEAMMDRMVHHGRPITCNRESYRVKHAIMRGEGQEETGRTGHMLIGAKLSRRPVKRSFALLCNEVLTKHTPTPTGPTRG